MILSKYVRVINLNWQGFLWGSFWALMIVSVFTAIIIGITWRASRESFVKNVLPELHNNKVGLLQAEIKSLKMENRELLEDIENLRDRILIVKKTILEGE